MESRRRIAWEIVIVLGVSLGQSAVYSIVQLLDLLTRAAPLASQATTINPVVVADRPWLDLIYQLLDIAFPLVPVLLVCWLLWSSARPHLGRLGIAFDRRVGADVGWGVIVSLCVGVGGIAVYLAGRALGITVAVDPSGLNGPWYTVPILLLSAARAGIQEEVIMIGYLFSRLRDVGWRTWPIILLSAGIRGSYHLYQGWGSFIGNAIMGIAFGWLYTTKRGWIGRAFGGRVLPLVIAHFIVDAVTFVGYPFAVAAWPGLFG